MDTCNRIPKWTSNCWNVLRKRITKDKSRRVVKIIKGESDKLYVNWEDFGNLFNSWIDKMMLSYKMSYFYTRSKSKRKVE